MERWESPKGDVMVGFIYQLYKLGALAFISSIPLLSSPSGLCDSASIDGLSRGSSRYWHGCHECILHVVSVRLSSKADVKMRTAEFIYSLVIVKKSLSEETCREFRCMLTNR